MTTRSRARLQRARRGRRAIPAAWIWIAVIVVAFVTAIGIASAANRSGPATSGEIKDVQIEGSSLPAYDDQQPAADHHRR